MSAKITFFPVGNGDTTLLELESGRTVLIDVNIRAAADDPDDDTPDVAKMLRNRLKPDSEGRLYVDAFLLSHPDKDHWYLFTAVATSILDRRVSEENGRWLSELRSS